MDSIVQKIRLVLRKGLAVEDYIYDYDLKKALERGYLAYDKDLKLFVTEKFFDEFCIPLDESMLEVKELEISNASYVKRGHIIWIV